MAPEIIVAHLWVAAVSGRARRACISLGSNFVCLGARARQPASRRAARIVHVPSLGRSGFWMRSDAMPSQFLYQGVRGAEQNEKVSRGSQALWPRPSRETEHPRRRPRAGDALRRDAPQSTDRRGSQCRSPASRGQPHEPLLPSMRAVE